MVPFLAMSGVGMFFDDSFLHCRLIQMKLKFNATYVKMK